MSRKILTTGAEKTDLAECHTVSLWFKFGATFYTASPQKKNLLVIKLLSQKLRTMPWSSSSVNKPHVSIPKASCHLSLISISIVAALLCISPELLQQLLTLPLFFHPWLSMSPHFSLAFLLYSRVIPSIQPPRSMLSNMVTTSHRWPLSTWNMVGPEWDVL